MTTVHASPLAQALRPVPVIAARAIDIVKTYGRDEATRVRALDGVNVAIRPAGSPPSWARPAPASRPCMHASPDSTARRRAGSARRDRPRPADRAERTLLRRDRIGFVFQAFNLVPTLTARRTSPCRSRWPAGGPTRRWPSSSPPSASRDRLATARGAVRRPATAGRRRPRPGHPARHRLRRRTHRQPRLPRRRGAAGVPARATRELGQTIVMVTHDPSPPRTPTGWCSSPTARRRRDARPQRRRPCWPAWRR